MGYVIGEVPVSEGAVGLLLAKSEQSMAAPVRARLSGYFEKHKAIYFF